MKPRNYLKKILSPEKLRKTFTSRFRRENKIVFTNGCFDLLHPGHVYYLNEARKKGDILVVALNTDESVQKIKGPTRPINNLKDRSQVMAALECVDYVTYFGEDTPLKIILKLMPDVVVKGGDYKISEIVGAKEVMAAGGKAYSLPFLKGKSTTQTIKKMSC